VTNKLVTVPEIRVLKFLHGEDAVLDIRPLYTYDARSSDPKGKPGVVIEGVEPCGEWMDERERERLIVEYEGASGPMDETSGTVARLFGPFSPLPKRLADIGINPREEARRLRAAAEEAARRLEEQAGEQETFGESEIDAFDEEFDADNEETRALETAPPVTPTPKKRGRPAKGKSASESLADAFG
jgi:hypothetical protein